MFLQFFAFVCVTNSKFYADFKPVTKIKNKFSQKKLFAETFATQVDKSLVFSCLRFYGFGKKLPPVIFISNDSLKQKCQSSITAR
jgi:hypothetical protein